MNSVTRSAEGNGHAAYPNFGADGAEISFPIPALHSSRAHKQNARHCCRAFCFKKASGPVYRTQVDVSRAYSFLAASSRMSPRFIMSEPLLWRLSIS